MNDMIRNSPGNRRQPATGAATAERAAATPAAATAEDTRLREDETRARNWKRFGPYLAARQWGTVREDYSESGSCWDYFPHEHARSRAYRWGEDGLLGFCDRQGRLCFALALWNGRDPILKERLFGLTGPEGNHGEDVKEQYYYLDSTPTHSYAHALYQYPQGEFPYARLVEENRRRGKHEPELELADTGAFADGRYFDVEVEYAKASPDDVLIRISVTNRGPDTAALHVLPTLWFRNTWAWGRSGEGYDPQPTLRRAAADAIVAEHATLGSYRLTVEGAPPLLFTDNESNTERLWGVPNAVPHTKDAFDDYVVHGRGEAVNPAQRGTKAAACYRLALAAGARHTLRLRLTAAAEVGPSPLGADFDAVFAARTAEADAFYAARIPAALADDERTVMRRAYAALLWSKQYFHYDVRTWLAGDPGHPAAPAARHQGRNAEWSHLYNRDVISMPDKWEYPWYAAWDLAFHMLPFAQVDPHFAKQQLVLFTREWYMHPNGQLPAYEFAFGDVNPPVHAWAAWRVYKMTGARGARDRVFLARLFQKLLLNFTWWVNRKDSEGRNLFGGGFLGLDNIGVFDRSKPLPTGGALEQADGTAWMAFYCGTMLSMALELAHDDPAYEDMASKFFEHFIAIVDAMHTVGGSGLWCEEDGLYYDQLRVGSRVVPLRVRSLVGLLPLLACEVLEQDQLDRLPGFRKRMQWFLDNRPDLAGRIAYAEQEHGHRLLAIPSREKLERVLRIMLDEREFLSPHGIRSVSRVHGDHPYVFEVGGERHTVTYDPRESTTGLFGGNSNWRGPVWFPVNYLLIEALQRYHHFYGERFTVECPTGSGVRMTLEQVARELSRRLASLFLPNGDGQRPCDGDTPREHLVFNEYFDGDTGRGLGASFQGWTLLVTRCLEDLATTRSA
ncbi:MAG: glucosidase [Deltaproteobacteria bacterium]|nr:glucosidase [Deltaproteobacteria bacterium]